MSRTAVLVAACAVMALVGLAHAKKDKKPNFLLFHPDDLPWLPQWPEGPATLGDKVNSVMPRYVPTPNIDRCEMPARPRPRRGKVLVLSPSCFTPCRAGIARFHFSLDATFRFDVTFCVFPGSAARAPCSRMPTLHVRPPILLGACLQLNPREGCFACATLLRRCLRLPSKYSASNTLRMQCPRSRRRSCSQSPCIVCA